MLVGKGSGHHKTIGQIVLDLSKKKQDTLFVKDLAPDMLEEHMANVIKCLEDNYEQFKHEDQFFIQVATKHERVLKTTYRQYFNPRYTCPTPFYDQTVYRWDNKTQQLEELWTIPDLDTCDYLIENITQLPTNELILAKFAVMFRLGSLLDVCKKLNKEENSLNLILTTEKEVIDVI
jgi:hypothetical protein